MGSDKPDKTLDSHSLVPTFVPFISFTFFQANRSTNYCPQILTNALSLIRMGDGLELLSRAVTQPNVFLQT
jgi:hypothetical protein